MKFRAAFRLLRVAFHLLRGALTVAVVFPRSAESTRASLRQAWSLGLLRTLGIRAETSGQLPASGLLVANHISFVDIFLINAVVPASFVSKADVSAWPLIGWLARHNDTIFLERGSRSAAQRTREALVGHLRTGRRVALFPEGTTTIGDHVLPFHSALLQSAIDAPCAVVPIAIRYADASGKPCAAPAYIDDIDLIQCLWAIARQDSIVAHVDILPGLSAHDGDRRHLSAHAHRLISHRVAPAGHAARRAEAAAGTQASPVEA